MVWGDENRDQEQLDGLDRLIEELRMFRNAINDARSFMPNKEDE